jgi:RND family efflux transporter MFP subunit
MLQKILLSAFLLALAACGADEQPTSEQPKAVKPVDVRITAIVQSDIMDEYMLPGVVEPWEVVSISTEITGHVKAIYKKEGDIVTAGETVVKIDTPNIDSDLRSTKIQYESAKQDYDRAAVLAKQGVSTQKAFEDAQNDLALMGVNYRLAQDFYNKSFATSPIDGVIDEIVPKNGEFVPAGQAVARVVQADRLKIYLNVPEKDAPYLSLNQEVDIVADNDAINIAKAPLGYISTMSNPQTLTYRARVDTTPSEDIYPGKIVRVRLLRKAYRDAIVVPLYAIMDVDGVKIAYIERDGLAIRTEVSIEAMIGSSAVIGKGLQIGDRLITTGQQFLSDKLAVRVVE